MNRAEAAWEERLEGPLDNSIGPEKIAGLVPATVRKRMRRTKKKKKKPLTRRRYWRARS